PADGIRANVRFWSRADARLSVATHEANKRQLRRRAEAHRRPPRAGAGAHIDPHPPAARQAPDVRTVDELDGQRPGKELARVRMAGELQIEAGALAERRELRVVREKKPQGGGFVFSEGFFRIRLARRGI